MTTQPTLVLLPGLDGSGAFFAPLCRHLPPNLTVKIIAYPQTPPMNYGELIQFALGQLPDGPLVLLGESFSGPVAIGIAKLLGSRVRGLVLAASFVRAPLPRALGSLLAVPGAFRLARWLAPFVLLSGNRPRELAAQIRSAVSALPRDTMRRRIEAALSVDATADFAALTCPTMALYARRDILIFPFVIKYIKHIRPDAIIRSFGAPHMLLQSKPAAAAAEIAQFISGIG